MLEVEYARAQGAAKRAVKRQIDALLATKRCEVYTPQRDVTSGEHEQAAEFEQERGGVAQKPQQAPEQPPNHNSPMPTGGGPRLNRVPAEHDLRRAAAQGQDPAGQDFARARRGSSQPQQAYAKAPSRQFPDELSALEAAYAQSRGAAQRAVKRQIDALLARANSEVYTSPQDVASEHAAELERARGGFVPTPPHLTQDLPWAAGGGPRLNRAPPPPPPRLNRDNFGWATQGQDPAGQDFERARRGPSQPAYAPAEGSQFPDELAALEAAYARSRGAAQRAVKRQIDALLLLRAQQAVAPDPAPRSPPRSPPRAAGPVEAEPPRESENSRLEELEVQLQQSKEAYEEELNASKEASKRAVKDVVKSTQQVLAAKVKALEDAVQGKGEEAEREAERLAAPRGGERRAAGGARRAPLGRRRLRRGRRRGRRAPRAPPRPGRAARRAGAPHRGATDRRRVAGGSGQARLARGVLTRDRSTSVA